MAGRNSPAGLHPARGLNAKFLTIKGGTPGDLTVTGIDTNDPLLCVLGIGKWSGVYFLNTVSDFTSEFTPGSAVINNDAGSSTTNWRLLVGWCDNDD